jgi:FKBP-type peptidyl-prolyl cis-trans isomerase FkpA
MPKATGNLSHLTTFLVYPVMVLLLHSCGGETQPVKSTDNFTMTHDTIINYNKGVVKAEEQEIEDVISRYHWKMEKSSTGLRYSIYKKGSGKKAVRGDSALFHYEIRLLNGNLCYSSREKGPRQIVLGRNPNENGLEEGILLMKPGDRAKLIVPSHLAFGLLGDQERIPPQSTLIYDVELFQLK